jgi:hypothetical protein
MREDESTFKGELVIMRKNARQIILGGCCTWRMLNSVHAVLGVCCAGCILYSVYAVLGVCCTQCQLMIMT